MLRTVKLSNETKSFVTLTSFPLKKEKAKKRRRIRKNRNRIIHRKRSKANYRRRRRQVRYVMALDELYDPRTNPKGKMPAIESIQQVVMWENYSTQAYWQSTAVALQYENELLHQHLKDMHIQLANVTSRLKSCNEGSLKVKHKGTSQLKIKGAKQEKLNDRERNKLYQPPKPNDSNMKEKMVEMYGKMAPKIAAMEVAVQLNYNTSLDKANPDVWPVIPLKLINN